MLDDLQWAHSGSLHRLFHIARELKEARLLLIGTYRPDDVALGRDGCLGARARYEARRNRPKRLWKKRRLRRRPSAQCARLRSSLRERKGEFPEGASCCKQAFGWRKCAKAVTFERNCEIDPRCFSSGARLAPAAVTLVTVQGMLVLAVRAAARLAFVRPWRLFRARLADLPLTRPLDTAAALPV